MKEWKAITIKEMKSYITDLVRYAAKATNTYKEKYSRLYREYWKRTGINVNQRVKNRKKKISKIQWFFENGHIQSVYKLAVELFEGRVI